MQFGVVPSTWEIILPVIVGCTEAVPNRNRRNRSSHSEIHLHPLYGIYLNLLQDCYILSRNDPVEYEVRVRGGNTCRKIPHSISSTHVSLVRIQK